MPICFHKRCSFKLKEQEEDEFVTKTGKPTKMCRTCREERYKYTKSLPASVRYRASSNGALAVNLAKAGNKPLEIGNSPVFTFEWEEGMHKEWLRELYKLVQRR